MKTNEKWINVAPHTYSDGVIGKKIAILGPYPPPLGGVSVHIKRVAQKLTQQQNTVRVFETVVEYRYRFFLVYLIKLVWFLLIFRPKILYYHTLYVSNSLAELYVLVAFKKLLAYHLVVIEHDCRYLYRKNERFKKKLNNVMPAVDELVIIGNLTYQSFIDNSIRLPKKYSIEAAFLPPDELSEQAILATYPESLFTFLGEHSPIIIANAFQLSLLNGKDLYGFDMCVNALAKLKKEFPQIGLVLVLGAIGDEAYFEQLKHLISLHQLENNIYMLSGQRELWPLLNKADLFVRPTLSDGASVSVQEALYFNIPVVASDVCIRPKETIIFRCGDQQDFEAIVKKVLRQVRSTLSAVA